MPTEMPADRPTRPPAGAAPARFAERLWPSPLIWFLTAVFGAALGLIPAPVSAAAAVIVAALGVVALITLLVVSTPALTVTDDTLRARRAHIPLHLVGDVEVLDAEGMKKARGRLLDARAYLCIRGWLPAGVKVALRDPADPTPYWLLSSRRPDELASAVRAGTARTGG